MKRILKSPLVLCILTYLALWLLVVAIHFPYDTGSPKQVDGEQAFYNVAYSPADEQKYVEIATRAAKQFRIEENVRAFVKDYALESTKVLDVGAGRGYLQDVVDDYTGLDISESAARFFHKPFVLGSATQMPFPDASFDAAWSIWVLEHIPNPEGALREMRRVVKPGGYLYLRAAWNCSPFAADGYIVRPYSDFGVSGKLKKASAHILDSPAVRASYLVPIRWLRSTFASKPTRLRYRALTPNYARYWQTDSDAVASIDHSEVLLWFESRGDKCLWLPEQEALVVQIGHPTFFGADTSG
ncbi:MAG: class I SAM-dependent methyltransferase [bacterium]